MSLVRKALIAGAIGYVLARRRAPAVQARRVLRISRVVADLDRAEAFYRDALGFQALGRRPANLAGLGAGPLRADEAVMRLGEQELALVRFTRPGRRYPASSHSNDAWFQHIAVVVNDMDAAYARLSAAQGWQPISEGGPQELPPDNGGVRAFKFRDPDGHPVELLWFPPGQGRPVWHGRTEPGPFLGIDHSALTVTSGRRSRRFYAALGFTAADQTTNRGPAQHRLDNVALDRVNVTSLRPSSSNGPGLELLAYHPIGRGAGQPRLNDFVTDWVTIEVSNSLAHPRSLRDPDRHRLLLVPQGAV